jgi:peptidoglycan/LPS O-acetylase OafA/YrhL
MSDRAPATDRYHALDSLRAFAMFLGVALHAAISFMEAPPAFWPVRDRAPTPLADVCLIAVHDFRMQLFFLLAGFFGCLLYQRDGLRGLLAHRLKRVAVPFVLALLLIVPTVQAVGLYCEIENHRVGGVRGDLSPLRPAAVALIDADPEASTAKLVAGFFTSGDWLARLPLVHLWFLYYLLLFVVAVAVLAPLFGRLTGSRLLARFDRAFRWLIESQWRVPALALLTFPLMLPMTWIVDTPTRWNPQWHVVGYYFAFFAFGWGLYRHRDLVPAFGRSWGAHLLIANLIVLPLILWLIVTGVPLWKAGAEYAAYELAGFAAAALYTWLMICGLWGAFLRLFARESARVRYLADSAYWCYLASITPIVVLQFAVKDWPLPGEMKAVLVTAATTVLLLASYEVLVRYTVIGAILNGKKTRKPLAASHVATAGASSRSPSA